MVRRIGIAGSLATLGLLLGSCFGGGDGGSGGGGGATCSRFEGKLRSCGLLSAGYFDCSEPDDDEDRCVASCVLAANCDELTSFSCVDIDSAAEAASIVPTLAACIERCQPPRFTCASGETIPMRWLCDGDDDCGDLSDEQGCGSIAQVEPPGFACGDGETVPADFTCDGYDDCTDGSDEAACPSFRCGDGQEIPRSYRCDGELDCADSSDESGCAEFQCGGDSASDSSASAADRAGP